jgi:hypothetical protein
MVGRGSIMAAIVTPSEQVTQKVILENVSWETYQGLLADRGERSQPRYNYDRGKLEINWGRVKTR